MHHDTVIIQTFLYLQRYGGRDKKYRHELGEYMMNFDSPLPLLKTFTLGTPCELKVLNEK